MAYNVDDKRYVDTAMDDLESFLWVLLYSALLIAEARGPLSSCETFWLSQLTSKSCVEQMAKISIVLEFAAWATSPVLVALASLVTAWYRLAADAKTCTVDLLKRKCYPDAAFCQKYYREYLQIGFSQLQTLPATWDEIAGEQPQGTSEDKMEIA